MKWSGKAMCHRMAERCDCIWLSTLCNSDSGKEVEEFANVSTCTVIWIYKQWWYFQNTNNSPELCTEGVDRQGLL